MKKDILIIAHFCDVSSEKANNRFNYIAEMFSQNDYNVELLTSDFSHKTKSKRKILYDKVGDYGYKLTTISEPGYKKNVSLKRLYSHYIFAKNIKKYLNSRKKPDVIYCAVPSLDAASVAAKYAVKNNIKFIIDVQDLWPEAFKMVLNIPILGDLIFYPMKRKANFIYSLADRIIAVSQTYVSRAMSVNKKCSKGSSIFLGTELEGFDKSANKNKISKPNNEIWLAYIGTLGHSYDLISVIDSLKLLKDRNIDNIKFIVMGDGPLKQKFENYAKEKEINIDFKGRLDYQQMVGVLSSCDIAVNPITKGAAQSIINKVGDYAAAGLPVINTQECSEYRELVDKCLIGLNCINGDSQDLSEKLTILWRDEELRKQMGANNRKLAEEKFDRKSTYIELLNIIN